MTAQIGDKYTFNGDHYSIVNMSERMDFHPNRYGLNPQMAVTCCWNGYWCEYNITEEGVFLERLYVYDADGKYPEINGVCASEEKAHLHHWCYDGLHMKMDYTGKILVGDKFLQKYYVHMGYQSAWSYEKLTSFEFKNGELVNVSDHSDIAAKLRELLANESLFEGKTKREKYKLGLEIFPMELRKKAWWLVG